MRGITNIANVVPLRLTGSAFAVYLQLTDEEKKSAEEVKQNLLATFAVDSFLAYKQFVARRLGGDESLDVFLVELRRLASLFSGVSDKALRGPEPQPNSRSHARGRLLRMTVLEMPEKPASAPRKRIPAREWFSQRRGAMPAPLGGSVVQIEAIVVDTRPLGFEFPFGMNEIVALGGVAISHCCRVKFRVQSEIACTVADDDIKIEEPDLTVAFSLTARTWTTRWKWKNGVGPEVLRNTVEEYPPAIEERVLFHEELSNWIQQCWLVPYNENKQGPAKVNEDVVKISNVVQHLAHFGLTSKAPVRIASGAWVLGLKIWGRAQSSSLVQRWGSRWDARISDPGLEAFLQQISVRVHAQDPARGRWDVSGNTARPWVDISSLALGVVLEVKANVVEDATWLRSDDASLMNMAELDAVIQGLNIALRTFGQSRLKTKAASEMLIRRHVGTVLALVKEYGLDITVTLAKSASNKVDGCLDACVYMASGNGIVERYHRAAKLIAAKKNYSIPKAVYLYNVTPRGDCTSRLTPAAAVYKYEVRVKLPGVRCDSRFRKGTVPGLHSRQAVIVDGNPCHVGDLRHCTTAEESESGQPEGEDQNDDLFVNFPGRVAST
ncbi:hypothetical protein TTRE_0000708701 [Trichuris trichiura]|uniref:Uncharacterized protein n=1 Tax=Trichuris trichiura TaxID=36087 RepID=A0A077ZEG1_TRITR|nr:hypothetical protein TTRE_0000708701 [Trichuris trichiura]